MTKYVLEGFVTEGSIFKYLMGDNDDLIIDHTPIKTIEGDIGKIGKGDSDAKKARHIIEKGGSIKEATDL